MSGRQIDRLLARAGRNNEMTSCECFLDGEDYSYYVKPLTPAQFNAATKVNRKGEKPSDLEASVTLFMLRALNADGTRQYQDDAFNILMRLPMDDLTKLTNAVPDEEGDDAELDIKSASEGVETKGNGDSRTVSSRKAGKNAD